MKLKERLARDRAKKRKKWERKQIEVKMWYATDDAFSNCQPMEP